MLLFLLNVCTTFQKVIEHCIFRNYSSVTISCFPLGLFMTHIIFCPKFNQLISKNSSIYGKLTLDAISQTLIFSPKNSFWALLVVWQKLAKTFSILCFVRKLKNSTGKDCHIPTKFHWDISIEKCNYLCNVCSMANFQIVVGLLKIVLYCYFLWSFVSF